MSYGRQCSDTVLGRICFKMMPSVVPMLNSLNESPCPWLLGDHEGTPRATLALKFIILGFEGKRFFEGHFKITLNSATDLSFKQGFNSQ